MSSIDDLIDRLELDEMSRCKQNEKQAIDREKKYENMNSELLDIKDRCVKSMSSIVKSLEQLLANKSTIETIVEENDDFIGLPIPYEHHDAAVDLVSNLTEFINNCPNYLEMSNSISTTQIHEDIINVGETVADDLKECHNEVAQAQSLYFNTISLKNLAEDSIGSEEN